MPAPASSAASDAARSPAPSSSRTSTTTAWIGASAGGTRRPASSPWPMISAPTRRVDTPHDVCQACSVGARRRLEGDVERLGEVLAQLVAGAHLQRLAVAHHPLEGVGGVGAGEALPLGLAADQHGQGHDVPGEVLVDVVQDAQGVGAGVVLGGVGGVALLPEELGGAQEDPGPQLPAHDVGPLVDEQGQVAVALHPLGEERVDDRLAGGAHDDGLLQLLAAGVGDHGQLGAEALDVLGLLAQVGLGDEEGEVGVLGAGGLDPPVQLGLHALPDGVAVGPDDHRAPDGAVVGQLGLGHHVLVPLGEVLGLRRQYRFGHGVPRLVAGASHRERLRVRFCACAHGLPARRRGADRAVQLAVRPPRRRHVHPAHRGHRRRRCPATS